MLLLLFITLDEMQQQTGLKVRSFKMFTRTL